MTVVAFLAGLSSTVHAAAICSPAKERQLEYSASSGNILKSISTHLIVRGSGVGCFSQAINKLKGICEKNQLDMAAASLAWVFQQESVPVAIVGASTPEQIERNSKVIKLSPVRLCQSRFGLRVMAPLRLCFKQVHDDEDTCAQGFTLHTDTWAQSCSPLHTHACTLIHMHRVQAHICVHLWILRAR